MTLATTGVFDASLPWKLHDQVSLRDEEFGALAYHHGTRRLVFLKSRELTVLVQSLDEHESAEQAISAAIASPQRARYEQALASLAKAEIICER